MSETVEQLCGELAHIMAEGLFSAKDIAVGEKHLAEALMRFTVYELGHSTTISPLLERRGYRTYSTGYFVARTDKMMIYLCGLYGRQASQTLRRYYFGLFVHLSYSHVIEGLISSIHQENTTVQFANLRLLLANLN